MSIFDILLNECTNKVTVKELINLLGTYPEQAFVTFVCKSATANPLCFKQILHHTSQRENIVALELEEIQDFRPHLLI